jgi:hypothetical protein
MIVSLMVISTGYANVVSTTNIIYFDVNEDARSEMSLSPNGLKLGSGVSSGANLEVAGNAMMTGVLSIGSHGLGTSNLHLSGSLGFGLSYVSSDNVTLPDSSIVLIQGSSLAKTGFIQLPSASQISGRLVDVKMISSGVNVILRAQENESIDGESRELIMVPSAQDFYPRVKLVTYSGNWYKLNSSGANLGLSSNALVGYWSFDQPSYEGNVIYDMSSKGNHGTFATSSTLGSHIEKGISGNAIRITWDAGISQYNHVRVPHHSSLDNNMGDMTVSAWYKPDNFSFSHMIFHKVSASSGPGYLMRTSSTSGNLTFARGDGTSGKWIEASGVTVSAWNHLVVTFQGSTQKSYVNGVLIQTDTNSKTFNAVSGDLFMGCKSDFTDGAIGLLDELCIYSRALSASEVLELYQKVW